MFPLADLIKSWLEKIYSERKSDFLNRDLRYPHLPLCHFLIKTKDN